MSRCKYQNHLNKYFSQEITLIENLELKEHLAGCSICSEKYQTLEELLNKLRKSNEEQKKINAPENLNEKILNSLPEIDIKETERTILSPLWKWGAVSAFAFAIIFAVLLVNTSRSKSFTVTFELYHPTAQTVSVAGDFNNWDPAKTVMRNYKGVWKVNLHLMPGQYQYMFVIDGKIWTADPKAEDFVDDGYGKKNSIVNIL